MAHEASAESGLVKWSGLYRFRANIGFGLGLGLGLGPGLVLGTTKVGSVRTSSGGYRAGVWLRVRIQVLG